MSNPPVGSLTLFAGMEWLVVHWDIEHGVMYLALKDIHSITEFGNAVDDTDYANSKLKAALHDFEEHVLLARSFTSEMVRGADNCFAFVPTAAQIENGFSLFQAGEGESRAFAVASFQGERAIWWTSTPAVREDLGGDSFPYFVAENGALRNTLRTTWPGGLRPFIRVRMR